MSTFPEVVFSEDELALLASLRGRPAFPGVSDREFDSPTWDAIARGLVARGVLGAGDPPVIDDAVGAVLDVVMGADAALWLTLMFDPGVGESGRHVLWRRGEEFVRRTWPYEGVLAFARCEPAVIDELLTTALDLPVPPDGWAAGPQQPILESEFVEALEMVAAGHGDGSAAAARYPAIAGFLKTVADARRSANLEVRRGDFFGEVWDGGGLTLHDSARHGLWMDRLEPGEWRPDRRVLVQPITVEIARHEARAIVDAFR